MISIIALGLAVLAIKFFRLATILLVDLIAGSIAAWYRWRANRLMHALVSLRPHDADIDTMSVWTVSRAHRRLVARSLRLSIAMTAHYSLFPASSRRGYAVADAIHAMRAQ